MGVLFTSHKTTTTATQGGVLINSGIFTCPDQIHRCIYRRNYFPIWQQGEKRETISDPSSFISYE